MGKKNTEYTTSMLSPVKRELYQKRHTEYYSCAGYFQYAANHCVERAKQDFYLLMLCTDGKGVYRRGDDEYHIESGDLILCYPGLPVYYASSEEEPWSLYWVHFDCHGDPCAERAGDRLEPASPLLPLLYEGPGSPDRPVIRCQDLARLAGGFERLIHFHDVLADEVAFGLQQSYFLELLYQGLSIFGEHRKPVNPYVESAVEYIERNLDRRITLEELGEASGVSRYHLCRLFREAIGTSPGQYVIRRKLDYAAVLLRSSNLPVGEIAERVGFENSMYFSNAFHHYMGSSPSSYRNEEMKV